MASLFTLKSEKLIELNAPRSTSDTLRGLLQRHGCRIEVHRAGQRGRQPRGGQELRDGRRTLRRIRNPGREGSVHELGDRGARRNGQRELGIAGKTAREVRG